MMGGPTRYALATEAHGTGIRQKPAISRAKRSAATCNAPRRTPRQQKLASQAEVRCRFLMNAVLGGAAGLGSRANPDHPWGNDTKGMQQLGFMIPDRLYHDGSLCLR
jgi:hypothetical protein